MWLSLLTMNSKVPFATTSYILVSLCILNISVSDSAFQNGKTGNYGISHSNLGDSSIQNVGLLLQDLTLGSTTKLSHMFWCREKPPSHYPNKDDYVSKHRVGWKRQQTSLLESPHWKWWHQRHAIGLYLFRIHLMFNDRVQNQCEYFTKWTFAHLIAQEMPNPIVLIMVNGGHLMYTKCRPKRFTKPNMNLFKTYYNMT